MKQFPPFQLDTVNQCLWRQRPKQTSEPIALGQKAFAVLRYLVEHAQQLVTHRELLQALWPDSGVQRHVIKSHILEIRSALGDSHKNPVFIETLSHRGYQFIAPVSESPSPNDFENDESARSKLVGRERDLGELRDCLEWTLRKRRRIVFIAGEAGIGKTALTDEFARLAAADPKRLRIARGQCIEGYGGKEAYYPMLEALGQLCRASDGKSVVQTLVSQAPTWLVQFPALLNREQREVLQREIQSATRERMLREMGDALETLTASTPLLLIFEDLHWVDNSTVDLISALARHRAPAQLMVVGTYRPFELELSEHPLKAVKQELLVHQLCQEIALQPLNERQILDYLAAESSPALVPQGLAAMVYRRSEGNPLFMVAAVDHLRERGLISHENGGWQLKRPLEAIDLEVPENLRQMIEAQLERLTPEDQRALELAAISGVSFSPNLSAPMANLEPEEFERLCDRLSRRHHLVRPTAPLQLPQGPMFHRYEFVHAMYREVLYRKVPPSRRTKLHQSIGECLERLWSQRPREVASELAHHFEEGGDWHRAIRYLRLVADVAGKRYAHRQATAILQHALSLASRLPETERVQIEIEILLKLASMYLVSLDSRAVETYEALSSRAAHYGLFDVELRALIEMAIPLARISTERSLAVIERALRLSAEHGDPLTRARARASCLARRAWIGGWNPGDGENYRAALAEIRRADDRAVLGQHLLEYGFIQSISSEYREAKHSLVESLGILAESGEENPYLSQAHWQRQNTLPRILLFLGEWGEALREIRAGVAMVQKNEDAIRAQTLRVFEASVHLHALDFAGVRAICESALPWLEHPWSAAWRRFGLALCGAAETALGDYSRALEHLSTAIEEMKSRPVIHDWYCRIMLQSSLSELWLDKGDLAQARAAAARFLNLALATTEHTWQTLAWEMNARVAMADRDAEYAQECIGNALSIADNFEVPLADWRAHATAAELYDRIGKAGPSQHHRRLSASGILRLANSLDPDEPLRKAFLSASMVRPVLASEEVVSETVH